MAKSSEDAATLPTHGAAVLPSVCVDDYNLEIEDEDGFVGDKASKSAFVKILEKWRQPLRDLGEDPLGEQDSSEIGKKKLDDVLANGSPEAAGVVQSAVEEFAQQLAKVTRRFFRVKSWKDTECIVVGGGFSESRMGELAVGRCAVLLKTAGLAVDFQLVRHDPDEAGLLGAAHLLPAWMLAGHGGMLAIDVGGTNVRTGLIDLKLSKSKYLTEAVVADTELWRHRDDTVSRDELIERVVEMLEGSIKKAKKLGIGLAPVIGIGCPGRIGEDGSIENGAQNLPGNWQSSRFNLPRQIREHLPEIGGQDTSVVMHNDAVVQGLSQLPYLQNVERWGILTIGTGLGNARFTNRAPKPKGKDR